MRYDNPNDEWMVECYTCSDEMPKADAIKQGDTFFCVFCLVDDQQYRIAQGMHVDPLPPKARRLLKAHVDRITAALKYPIGA